MAGLGFSEPQAGLTSTAEISAVALACLVLSAKLERLPLRKLAFAGLLVVVAANLLTYLLVDLYSIITVRIASGVGAGMCLAVTSALIGRTQDPDRTVGLLYIISTLTMALVLTLLGYAKSAWLFNGYVSLFLLVALLLLPCALLVPAGRGSTNSADVEDSSGENLHLLLGIFGLCVFFLLAIQDGSIWSFSERAGVNIGIGDEDIGVSLALAMLAGLLGAALASIAGARLPRVYPICIGIILTGVAGFVIYRTDAHLVYSVSLCAFSFGVSLAVPYLLGAFAKLDAAGSWVAKANGINLLGTSIAPSLSAMIVNFAGYRGLGLACVSLAIVCALLAAVFSLRLKEDQLDTPAEVSVAQVNVSA